LFWSRGWSAFFGLQHGMAAFTIPQYWFVCV
jgi:hypothetical protein